MEDPIVENSDEVIKIVVNQEKFEKENLNMSWKKTTKDYRR